MKNIKSELSALINTLGDIQTTLTNTLTDDVSPYSDLDYFGNEIVYYLGEKQRELEIIRDKCTGEPYEK